MPLSVLELPDALVNGIQAGEAKERDLRRLYRLLRARGLIDRGGGTPMVEERDDQRVQLVQEIGTFKWIAWEGFRPVSKTGTAYLKVWVPEQEVNDWRDFLICVAGSVAVTTALYVLWVTTTGGAAAITAPQIAAIVVAAAAACFLLALGIDPQKVEGVSWELEVVQETEGGGPEPRGGGGTPGGVLDPGTVVYER